MTLVETGRATYIVTDQSGDRSVDLLRFDCNGQCDCWYFKKYLIQQIEAAKAGGCFVPGAHTCPHIDFADKHFVMQCKSALAKQFPDNEDVT